MNDISNIINIAVSRNKYIHKALYCNIKLLLEISQARTR